MDVDVIDVEGMSHRAMANDGDAEPNASRDSSTAETITVHDDDDGIGEPYLGMEFDSEDAAKFFYDEYAIRVGFHSKAGPSSRSKSDGSIISREFICGRDGVRRQADSCEAMLKVELKGQDKWVVTKFVKEHSHSLVNPNKLHYIRPRRHFVGTAKTVSEAYQGTGAVPSGVMFVSMDGNRSSAEKNSGVRHSPTEVAKFEDDNKAYHVTLNYSEMKANCSCQMFEYSGILCRHVLTVFTVSNVLTLPSAYILKRWTRNAKSGAGLDEHSSDSHAHESLTLRYNNLCREAIRYAEEGAIATETYNAAMNALRDGGKKIVIAKKNAAKVAPPCTESYDDRRNSTLTSDSTPLLWPRHDEVLRRFNLNDASAPLQTVADLNLPRMGPVSLHRDDGTPENMVVLPCLKSMTWVMENKNSTPGNRVAVINLKLQDYSRTPSAESEVKFQLSRVSLEPMLRSMAYISEQLSTPANKVAVINLKLQDTETTSGESEVKFQVSKDTLGAMLRSMAYIREQLSNPVDMPLEPLAKKQRK
ncbi:hypothetical protein G4B88_000840 [Cannabis sativa]|uniref:SWIM-type domain-containing protein n=1 Tax=Cannabis sativa TaxID=3483 RepID=A0A7J6DX36_CANSA|nr:hypothetical protein G4B88_000840 [Cannabis sativa]